MPPLEPLSFETDMLMAKMAAAPKEEFIPEYHSIGEFYENLEKGE